MKLSRAIALGQEVAKSLRDHKFEEAAQAVQLGIEALKREQILRREIPYDREGLLPGETEEDE